LIQNVKKLIQLLKKPNLPAILHGATIKFNKEKNKIVKSESDSYLIITGGSRGIGKAIAKNMAKLGKNLIITGRPGNTQLS